MLLPRGAGTGVMKRKGGEKKRKECNNQHQIILRTLHSTATKQSCGSGYQIVSRILSIPIRKQVIQLTSQQNGNGTDDYERIKRLYIR